MWRRMGGALGRRWTEAQVDRLLAVLGVDDVLPQLGQDLLHRLQIEPRACHVGGLVELGHQLEEARRIAGGLGDVLILFALRSEHNRPRLTSRLGQEVVRIAPALVDLVFPGSSPSSGSSKPTPVIMTAVVLIPSTRSTGHGGR